MRIYYSVKNQGFLLDRIYAHGYKMVQSMKNPDNIHFPSISNTAKYHNR